MKSTPGMKCGEGTMLHSAGVALRSIFKVFIIICIIAPSPIIAGPNFQVLLQQARDTDAPQARLQLLYQVLKTAPSDTKLLAAIHFELGMTHKELKRYGKAIKEFDLSLGYSKDSVESLLEKAHCLILINRLSTASSVLEQILATRHGVARAYVLKAQVYEKQGFSSKAKDELTRALYYNPHSPLALEMRAKLLMRAGKPRQALQDIDHLSRMARHRPGVFLMRARIQVSLKDYPAALKDYEIAEQLEPESKEIVKEKVIVFFKMDQPKKVLETLASRLDKGAEDVDVLILRARAYIGLKSYSAAEKMLQRVLRKQPSHSQAQLYMGVSAMRQGNWDAALACFNRAIEIDSSLTAAYKERARTFVKLEEHVRAIEDLSLAANMDQSDGEIFAMRGNSYVHQKLYDAAIEDFTRALERTPGDPRILYARAYAYSEKEDLDSALQDLNMLLQILPRSCQAQCLRGVVHMKQGSIAHAKNDFDEAVKCDPKNSVFYNNRGYFHYKTGAYDAALADFNRALSIYPAYDIARYNLQLVMRKQKAEKALPPAVARTISDPNSAHESHTKR